MRKIILPIILLLFYFGTPIQSQQSPPPILSHAAQCLALKHFLPPSKAKALTFGYIIDDKSYPGDKVLYIVNYLNSKRSRGIIFSIFLAEKHGHQEFNLQNNASFVSSKKDPNAISFTNPPLGGTWTQEHLTSAIQEIGKHPTFTVSPEGISFTNESISCVAYTDPRSDRR